jgi:hypothetical protein
MFLTRSEVLFCGVGDLSRGDLGLLLLEWLILLRPFKFLVGISSLGEEKSDLRIYLMVKNIALVLKREILYRFYNVEVY